MSAASADDCRWLDAAARLARPYLGTTGEYPTVGALVVDEASQQLVARAVTPRGGRPHAEVQALAGAQDLARGRTLYVTLEPSSQRERAPPGTDAIVEAGIGRVVVGVLDPALSGAGARRLQQHGIEVVLADHGPSRLLHEAYIIGSAKARPFVTAGLVVSRDGMIGVPDRSARPIASEATRRWLSMQRALSDAVMVGDRTARLDDPQLTVRLEGLQKRAHARVVLAGSRPLDPELNLFRGVSGHPTVIIAENGLVQATPPQVHVIHVEGRNGRPDLRRALAALRARGVGRLLVEGGAALTEALLAAELVDRFHMLSVPEEIGRRGVAATPLGGIDGRLRGAGFVEVDRQFLDTDMLRTFEKEL